MDRLNSMQIFIRVVELESFTKAGESMGLPKASVSNHVQQLETLLGTRLLYRTTRKVQLTQDGANFYERCKDLLIDVDEIETMFQTGPSTITGKLRVDMPSGFARNFVMPRLPEFLSIHPHVELELSCTDRKVDVVKEGFDCVLRVGSMSDSGLMARQLGHLKIINCVSQSYIKKWGHPKNLEDLNKHQLIHYVGTFGAKSQGWEYLEGDRYKYIKMKGAITVNNSDAYLASCLAGLGIIQVPLIGVRKHLKDGTLVEILSKYKSEPMPVSIVYPHRRNLSKRVQVFMDWLDSIVKDYVQ